MFAGFRHLTLEKPLVVLDLAATGPDPLFDRLVGVAAIRCDPGGKVTRRRQLLNPLVPIPPAAAAAYGITNAAVAGAPPFAELAPKLAALLDGADLAGFGLRESALLVLMAEFDRAGLPLSTAGRSVVDAYELFLLQEPRDLAAAVRRYLGSEAAGRHAAGARGGLADATAAAAVLDRIVAAAPELPITPAGLQRHCGWADASGRFRFASLPGGREEVVFAFGRHRGRPLAEVARAEPDYLRWMLAVGFAADACELIRAVLAQAGPGR